jgi:hypothetical protein
MAHGLGAVTDGGHHVHLGLSGEQCLQRHADQRIWIG